MLEPADPGHAPLTRGDSSPTPKKIPAPAQTEPRSPALAAFILAVTTAGALTALLVWSPTARPAPPAPLPRAATEPVLAAAKPTPRPAARRPAVPRARAAPPRPAERLPAAVRAAVLACASEPDRSTVSLSVAVDTPVLTGRHAATAWCNAGALATLEIRRGDDAWITWMRLPDGLHRTIAEFDPETTLPTGYRTTVDGVETERGRITRADSGHTTLEIERDGAVAERMTVLKGALSAESARAVDAWLDAQGHPPEVAGPLRESLNEIDAETVHERFEAGELVRRQADRARDLGDGITEREMQHDNDGDGRVDVWALSQQNLGGAHRAVYLFDRDRDGRFEAWQRTVEGQPPQRRAIDWPVERVSTERLRADLHGGR